MEADESTEGEKKPQSIFGSKGENIIKRILMFIPRLLDRLVDYLIKKWDNRKSQRLLKKIDQLYDTLREQKEKIYTINDKVNELSRDTDKNTRDIETMDDRERSMFQHIKNHDKQLDALYNTTIQNSARDIPKINRVIDFMNGRFYTGCHYKVAMQIFQDMLKLITKLEEFDPYSTKITIDSDSVNKIHDDINKRCDELNEDNEDHALKFDEIKNYIQSISDIREQIVKRAKSLESKFNKILNDKNEHENESTTNINTCKDILKYIQSINQNISKVDNKVIYSFNTIEKAIDNVKCSINKGLSRDIMIDYKRKLQNDYLELKDENEKMLW